MNRRWTALAVGVGILAIINTGIYQREQLVRHGEQVFVALAPVDPRSIMQGDYMRLRFEVAVEAERLASRSRATSVDGKMVLALAPSRVATFVRIDDGQPVAEHELRVRYRVRRGRHQVATNAYFFEEGRAQHFARAAYGELRLDAEGEAILVGLRDADLNVLGSLFD